MATETIRADGLQRYVAPFAVSVVGVAGAAYSALNDPFRETLFPKCLLFETTGLACPACGATRATHLLLHGDIAGALDYNALLVILVPLVLLGMLRWWLGASRRWPSAWTLSRVGIAAALLFAWAIVRNLPFEPFAALNL